MCELTKYVGVIPTRNLEEMGNVPFLKELAASFSQCAHIVTPAMGVKTKEYNAIPRTEDVNWRLIDPVVLMPITHIRNSDLQSIMSDCSIEAKKLGIQRPALMDGYVQVTAWGDEAKMPEFMNAHNN